MEEGNPIIPSLIKEHDAFPNIIISKGLNINNSHGELWGIMDSFICIIVINVSLSLFGNRLEIAAFYM